MAISESQTGNIGMSPQTPAAPPGKESFPYPPTDLIESDGEPLESDWHVRAISLMCDIIGYFFLGREDYYVGGNMFIYFNKEQARNLDYRGPDFFFVNGGVARTPLRPYWAIWNEKGRYPDVIIELLSPTTKNEDLTTKKDLYEKTFGTSEYYCYDPDTQELMGWRLMGKFQRIEPNEKGWLWSEQLGLWVGTWQGPYQGYAMVWLRFFDKSGNLVPTFAEAAKTRADEEQQRADAEQQRAEAEHQRADALEAELARLKAQTSPS